MTIVEVATLCKTIEFVYPNFLKDREPKKVVGAWHWILESYDKNIIAQALQEYCETERIPPVPADIIKRAKEIKNRPYVGEDGCLVYPGGDPAWGN